MPGNRTAQPARLFNPLAQGITQPGTLRRETSRVEDVAPGAGRRRHSHGAAHAGAKVELFARGKQLAVTDVQWLVIGERADLIFRSYVHDRLTRLG